jgi:dihydrofolate reductase
MRKLIVSTFLTLDGGMQAPGGPGEDDSGGFAYGGWSVKYWDEQMGQVMGEAMSRPFGLVLGRKTYYICAAHWPHAPEEAGAKTLNDATKYVASRTHPMLEWSNSVLIEGDAAEGIAALKKEDGPELQVHGSGNLIQTLLRHNLVDQYRLWVVPPVGLPPRHRVGQTPVLGRHHPLRAEARRQQGLDYWSRDRYVRAGRRDRHRILRAGLSALVVT